MLHSIKLFKRNNNAMDFYIYKNGSKLGPYGMEDLKKVDFNKDTLVWCKGFDNWKKAEEVPELEELLASIPPATPTEAPMPNTWLVESILITLFCCLPFGIASIVYASKVESQYMLRNYQQAEYYSRQAKNWTIAGLVCGLLIGIFYFITIFGFSEVALSSLY